MFSEKKLQSFGVNKTMSVYSLC